MLLSALLLTDAAWCCAVVGFWLRSKSGKKATACTFSADSQHVFFSDRFGDVLCAPVLPAAADAAADAAPAAVEGSLLLGHLQSIVTSLTRCSSSTGQQLLVSTDKDGKVRASVLPVNPVKVGECVPVCGGGTDSVGTLWLLAHAPKVPRHLCMGVQQSVVHVCHTCHAWLCPALHLHLHQHAAEGRPCSVCAGCCLVWRRAPMRYTATAWATHGLLAAQQQCPHRQQRVPAVSSSSATHS